jgi:hypothetical protein
MQNIVKCFLLFASTASLVSAVACGGGQEDTAAGNGALAEQPTGSPAAPSTSASASASASHSAAPSASAAPAPSSVGLLGLYETETTHRAWAIRITSENPPMFRIFAGHLEDASERVDAPGLVGKLSGTTVTYENGPDCAITLAKNDLGLEVTQAGTCAAVGFPANDDLSMSEDLGTDFQRLDESKECFDTTELSVGATPGACKTPL